MKRKYASNIRGHSVLNILLSRIKFVTLDSSICLGTLIFGNDINYQKIIFVNYFFAQIVIRIRGMIRYIVASFGHHFFLAFSFCGSAGIFVRLPITKTSVDEAVTGTGRLHLGFLQGPVSHAEALCCMCRCYFLFPRAPFGTVHPSKTLARSLEYGGMKVHTTQGLASCFKTITIDIIFAEYEIVKVQNLNKINLPRAVSRMTPNKIAE